MRNQILIPSLIVLTESLLLQSRYIDAEAFLNQADHLDKENRHKRTINKLRNIIQKNYNKHLIAD